MAGSVVEAVVDLINQTPTTALEIVRVHGVMRERLRVFEHVQPWAAAFRERVDAMRALVDPCLPRVVDASVDDDDDLWVLFEHMPRIELRDLLRAAPGGVALPLACSVVVDLSRVLVRMSDRGETHGALGLDSVALSIEGRALLNRPLAPPISPVRAVGIYPANFDTMSPEAVRATSMTSASDVFSLSALWFGLLTGASPFHSATWMEVLVNIVTKPAPPLVHDSVPTEVSSLIAHMLAQDPAARPHVSAIEPTLREAAPWAQWTHAQCADELRALVPAEIERVSKRARPTLVTT